MSSIKPVEMLTKWQPQDLDIIYFLNPYLTLSRGFKKLYTFITKASE